MDNSPAAPTEDVANILYDLARTRRRMWRYYRGGHAARGHKITDSGFYPRPKEGEERQASDSKVRRSIESES